MQKNILHSRKKFMDFLRILQKDIRFNKDDVMLFYKKGEMPIEWIDLIFQKMQSKDYEEFNDLWANLHPDDTSTQIDLAVIKNEAESKRYLGLETVNLLMVLNTIN